MVPRDASRPISGGPPRYASWPMPETDADPLGSQAGVVRGGAESHGISQARAQSPEQDTGEGQARPRGEDEEQQSDQGERGQAADGGHPAVTIEQSGAGPPPEGHGREERCVAE